MKNYTTLILAGLVVVLAAVLIGVMVYIQNQPAEVRAVQPLVEIAAMEPDSAKSKGINYPNQYDSLMKTKTNNTDTAYAGSSQFSWLNATRARFYCLPGMASAKITTMIVDMPMQWRMSALPCVSIDKTLPELVIPANHLITPVCGQKWAWKLMTRCFSMS